LERIGWFVLAVALAAPALAGGGRRAATDARIGKVMRAHAPQIRQCYEQQLAQNPKLQGRVQLSFVAQADGTVSDVRVDDQQTTLKSSELHRCLVATVTAWRLPKHAGDGVVVSLPVVFTQAD
jgi:outer membrane biosynthesis protein TonB